MVKLGVVMNKILPYWPSDLRFPAPFLFGIEGMEMKRIDLTNFYNFGLWIGFLRLLPKGKSSADTRHFMGQAMMWLRACLIPDGPLAVPFKTCKAPAENLLKIVADVHSRISVDLKNEITQNDLEAIQSAQSRFETVFSEEMPSAGAFLVAQKGIYDSRLLIESADEELEKVVRDKIPSQSIDDLRSAGRCIAFELPTAAGFHAFRALERVMVDYLGKLNVVVPPKSKNMGMYITLLEQNGADAQATVQLKQLKDRFRNPLFHPDDNLDPGEDIGVFSLSASSISWLVKDMLRRGLT